MSSTLAILSGLAAHPSGALFLTNSQTLIVADLHLGFSWAQRRRGELGPLADAKTHTKLLAVVEQLRPARIVFLGDLVHAPRPATEERAWIEGVLLELSGMAELIAVRGNHDRAFAREFLHLPVRTVDVWAEGRLVAVHGDRLPAALARGQVLLTGHLHPALVIRDAAGAGQKLSIFLVTNECVVLPAFSPFAGGYDVTDGLPGELSALLGRRTVEVYATSNKRLVRLGPLGRSVEHALTGYRRPQKQS